MTVHDIDRIQNAIDHIKTSLDVDPWAMEIAVGAMQEKMEHFADVSKKDDIREYTKKTDDLIRRQDAIRLVEKHYRAHDNDELELIAYEVGRLPSAQPEIIHCRDCRYHDERGRSTSLTWLPCMEMQTADYWYCGSGRR